MVIDTGTEYEDLLLEPGSDRISYKRKIANDYAWARKKIDYYASRYNFYAEKKEKFKVNYDLYNGRMDFDSFIETGKNIGSELGLDIPEIEHNQSDYIHFPILQTVLHDLEGEEIKRPFNLRVVSTNSNSEAVRQKKTRELLVENTSKIVKENQLQKLKIQHASKLQQLKAGIDPNVDPDYVQKMQEIDDNFNAQLEELSNKMTPLEVETYMSKGFRLPEEKLTDEILQYHIRTDRLKFLFDKGWKDVIVTGEEIYWTGDVNGKPTIKVVNPLYFNYSKSKDVDYLDESDWCAYDEYLSVYEIYQRFGNTLSEKERNVLDKYESALNSPSSERVWDIIPNAIMNNASTDAAPHYDPWDSEYEDTYKTRRLRVTHVVWKTLKKIKYIFRLNENGNLEKTIVDETYVFDKSKDVKQEILWVPEYWQGYKIFTNPKIYLKVEPIANQYRDIDNPFQIRGPYTGTIYSSRNSHPIAIADLGKPWQFLYNVVINQIIELMKTDIGRVLLGLNEQIPKNMSPTQWMTYIKKYKVALINATRDGDLRSLGIDPQYWKSIDLSHTQEVSQKIELLEYIEKKMTQSMSYNPNRLGQQSPYESVSNNQQNIIQSSNQTEKWFYMHNYVKERTIENYIEICKEIYKDNPLKASYILSDLSMATLNTEAAEFANYNYKVYLSNTLRDTEILNSFKQLIQPIIQNSDGDMRIAAEILTSENATEVKNIIHRIQEQREAKMEQEQVRQQQMQQQQLQAQQTVEQEKMKLTKEIADNKNTTIIEAANIQSNTLRNANDVNDDGQSDFIELELMKQKDGRDTKLTDKKIEQMELQNKKLEKEIKFIGKTTKK
jgi:hypothetical protein